jgi:hypothetical protein
MTGEKMEDEKFNKKTKEEKLNESKKIRSRKK